MLCNAGRCVDIVTIHVHVHALQVHVYVCTAGIIITTCGGAFKTTHEIWLSLLLSKFV